MPARHAPLARLALVLGALAATGCGDSPVTPDDLGAQSSSTAAMFAEIIGKLESIEQRIDSLEATMEGTGGGGLVLSGLPAAQLDSIMALASYLAEDASTGSLETCASAELGGEFGIEWKGGAEGEGAGHLGAWAGTGAYAGGKITYAAEIGGGFKLAGQGGIGFCYPLNAGTPPTRPQPAGPARSPELDALQATLAGLTSQFNLTATTLSQSITGVGNAIGSPSSLSLTNLGGNLPLPPALSTIAADPMGTVSTKIQGVMATAQSSLCTSNQWGPNVATVITEACDVIASGGLANITAFADIANTYPTVQTAMSNACTRINSIGLQRLIIPSWDVTFPLGIGTVEVFPGYNQRLFANYTSFACP